MNIHQFIEYFGEITDPLYLEVHFSRFCATKDLAYRNWKWERADILDIGAHWLHQSVLYAMDGHRVTAADFTETLDYPVARTTASRHHIKLLPYTDLGSESVFDSLDEDSMDVILFCEILEHITFNPVNMWKAIYRVLRPGGRIIVTTPNFYSAENVSSSFFRLLSGWGGGITVQDILNKKTNGPHWKEYSKKEMRTYFELLSPDFRVSEQCYFPYIADFQRLNWKGKLVYGRHNVISLLRKGLYTAVDLQAKGKPIDIEPKW